MPNVSFMRHEVKRLLPIYQTVSDCCDGDFKVKYRKEKYLPKPNPTDVTPENIKRYEQYLQRAIFYNVTKNTYAGLIGQIFSKKTQIELPKVLEILEDNADGSGKGLEELAKEGVGNLLKNARFGLLSEYPKTEGELTKADLENGKIRPVIKLYKSNDIINWRTKVEGAELVYSLVVLREKVVIYDDGFEIKQGYRYRVLKLNESGNYEVNLYEANQDLCDEENEYRLNIALANFNFQLKSENIFIPTDVSGNTLKRIPFEFCGCDNNDADPDVPVLYDVAVLNLGHYRNSADYEESCYIVGQPTPWFSGLSQEWVKDNPVIQLGSRAAIPLPENGTAGMLQADPNTMPIEAMKHKEAQLLALGAKLVSPTKAQTATQSEIDNVVETSVLGTIAQNASKAFERACKNCLQFVTNVDEKIIFELNDDFEITKMTPADRLQLLNEWMKGGISFTEYRSNLRAGKVDLTDDETALKEIEQQTLADFKTAMKDPANQQKPPVPSVGK
jgi:hypothetical protein